MKSVLDMYLRLYLLPIAAALLIVAFGMEFQADATQSHRQNIRLGVEDRAAEIRARIEGLIRSNIALGQGLATEIVLSGGIDESRFRRFARHLLSSDNQVRNIAIVPDMVVSAVYPLAGNESVLGLNLATRPDQYHAAIQARDSARTVLSGPVRLVQGGEGFITRIPVFVQQHNPGAGKGRFWGLVSQVIDASDLYRMAGLLDHNSSLKFALRGRDGSGAAGPVFFGAPDIYTRDPVLMDVKLPAGSWQLAVLPEQGWPLSSPYGRWIRFLTLAAAVLGAVFLSLLSKWRSERQLEEQARRASDLRLKTAIETLNEGFVMWDRNDAMVMCNQRYRDIFPAIADLCHPGVRFEELIRVSAARGETIFDSDTETWLDKRRSCHQLANGYFEERLSDDKWIFIKESRQRDGGIVGVYLDISELKLAEQDIHFRAQHDPLTGLPNRGYFMTLLDQELARAKRQETHGVLMFLDIDRLKNVNDTLGHAAGDELLVRVADRLQKSLRDTDTVARISGDEFTIIAPHLSNDMHAIRILNTIDKILSAPYMIHGQEIHSSASIGISLYPRDGLDSKVLLRNADLAMYQAKSSGRNCYRFFTGEFNRRAQEFASLEKDLRGALKTSDLFLDYQPILRAADGRLAGLEALVRWRHPQRGLLMPDRFIPVAEQTGLISELGIQVLERACEQFLELDGQLSGSDCYLAVNVSTRQFQSGLDVLAVQRILDRCGFAPDRLVLEITESLLMENDDRIQHTLSALRALGVRLSVDDFGTGYSSLSYLHQFPVDILKIDKSFIQLLDSDSSSLSIVKAVLAMADSLGLAVVSEGVETAAQAGLLRQLGCDLLQGYYLGYPQSPLELVKRFASASAKRGDNAA